MHPFRHHVFVCDQRKPEGAPCCSAHGSIGVTEALRREVANRGLSESVAVTTCGSLGMCEKGPNLVVYPEGIWYSHVSPQDVPEIVTEHLQNGHPVARLMRTDEGALKAEIALNRRRAAAMLKARETAGIVPDDLSEQARGYMPSRVLLTAIELGVFTAVSRAAAPTAEVLSEALGTNPRATRILLDALVALGLLAKREGLFGNGRVAARYLVEGAPDDASTALKHNLFLWATWSELTEVVRTGESAQRREMHTRGDDWTVPFIAAMHRNAALRAPALVKSVGTTGVRRFLDIGGGSGAYSIAFAREVPALEAEVFDLATVVPIARRHVEEAGLDTRVHTCVGDLRRDSFGEGFDLALLSAICHMLGPDEIRDLFRRVFLALAPRGRLVIQDHVMFEDRVSPRAGAMFAINMLVGTPHGSTYTESEYRGWLAEAGFSEIRRVSLQGPNDLILGTRPA